MRTLLAIVDLAGRLRRRLRLRLWAARTRLALRRRGCRLELVTGRGAGFRRSPVLEVQRQDASAAAMQAGGGRLVLDLGAWSELGENLVLEVAPGVDTRLALGEGVRLGTGVRLVAAGGELVIGAWSDVRDGVVLKVGGALRIGEHSVVSYQTVVHCAEAVAIGERVNIGERVSIIDSDHPADGSDAWILERPIRTAAVSVGRNTWLGANAVLMRGVRLGENAVVAAGSVVRGGDYPPGWLVAGAPAAARRSLADPPPPDAAPG